jgi:hypothetical protein
VEHAGQDDVVDVVALAADEAGVLLAEHAAEPDRVGGRAGGLGGRLGVRLGRRRWGGFGGGHRLAASCSAAQRVARTMFS